MKKITLIFLFFTTLSCEYNKKEILQLKESNLNLEKKLAQKNSDLQKLQLKLNEFEKKKLDKRGLMDSSFLSLANLLINEKYHATSVKLFDIDSISYPPYVLMEVGLRSPENGNSFNDYQGHGAVLIDKNAKFNKLVWYYIDEISDFPPHTFRFVDFNEDDRPEILVYGGFEDVFYTKIFLNQIGNHLEPFKEIYHNPNQYVPLFDFDEDEKPELLAEVTKTYYDDGSEPIIPEPYEFGPKSFQMIIDEYDKNVGSFDFINFEENSDQWYKIHDVNYKKETRILSIKNDSVVDVSINFPNHYKSKIDILNSLVHVNQEMQKQIDGIIFDSKLFLKK